MDGRVKLVCMVLLSITVSIASRISDRAILTFILLIALFNSKLPVKKLLTELKYFLVLIILVLLVHSFSIPGTPATNWPMLNPTWEGISSGLIFGWRIILLVAISTIFIATTTLYTLKNVIEWLLHPLPLVPEAKVSTMIGLTFTLVPLIFDQASEMLDAQKSRCIAKRKNPIERIFFLVFPLLLQTFRRADEMILAMESRCYSEQRTPAVFKTKTLDWVILLGSGFICCAILLQLG
jgi:biotin transport system permease protein